MEEILSLQKEDENLSTKTGQMSESSKARHHDLFAAKGNQFLNEDS
jgi:hypothetical protein